MQNNVEKLIKTTGAVIRKHREMQDKTMYKISAETSMSKAARREAEIGASKDIKFTTLWKIAEGLDVPLEQIIKDIKEELGEKFSLTDLK